MNKIIYFITLLCLLVTSLFVLPASAASSNLAYGAAYTTYEVLDNERYNVGLTVSGYTGSLNDGKYSMAGPADGGSVADWFAFRNDTTMVNVVSNCVTGLGQVLFDLGSVSKIGCVKVYISTLDYYTCESITVYAGSENQYYLDAVGVLTMPKDDYGWAILNLEEVVSAQYLRLEFKVADGNTCLIGEIQLYSAPDETDVTVENKTYSYPPLSSTADIYWVHNNQNYELGDGLYGGPVISWWGSTASGINGATHGYDNVAYADDTTYYYQCTINPSAGPFEIEGAVSLTEKTFLCSYNYGKVDLTKYNYISFTVYPLIKQSYNLSQFQRIAITVDGKPYYGGDIAFTRGPAIEYTSPGVTNPSYVYPYKCEVYLDEGQNLGKVTLGVQFLADLNCSSNGLWYFAMGVTPLTAEEKTQEQFVAGIASNIVNIQNVAEDTNKTVHIISDNVGEIVDALNTGVTPEQKERIEQDIVVINEAKAKNEAANSAFNYAINSFKDDMDYDIFVSGGDYMDSYLEPLYGSGSAFIGFWNGIWSHEYVVAMVLTAALFAMVGFGLYGVR